MGTGQGYIWGRRNFPLEEEIANAKALRQECGGLCKRKGTDVAKAEIAVGGDTETIIQCFMTRMCKATDAVVLAVDWFWK